MSVRRPTNNSNDPNNQQDESSPIGYRLDPTDWDAYRFQMHQLLDECCSRMKSYRELPWQPPPSDMHQGLCMQMGVDDLPGGDGGGGGNENRNSSAGRPLDAVVDELVNDIMPYATGNTHPKFMGWVHGAGLPSSTAADLVASTMNCNVGGRHQGAAEVERSCINFLCEWAGFTSNSEQPFGVLTQGTSQATIYALCAARTFTFGYDVRKSGIRDLPPVRLYCSSAAHSCLVRAMECLGHGSNSVFRVPIDPASGAMQIDTLRRLVEEDKVAGIQPLAIVGTAGSVTVGAYDDFAALADLAAEHKVWFHVDAAFGFWTRLSQEDRIRSLTNNIHRANSIALDAHKWPGVQYDCGALLVRDKDHLRCTLASRPAYLQSASEGLAGGDLWFTDFSLDLSRGFRALKLWTALQVAGTDKIGAVITDHCALAFKMGELVEASPLLELAHPVISNICCFYIRATTTEGAKGAIPIAAEIAAELQLKGTGVFSTVALGDRECLRAAIVNHRITPNDINEVMTAVEQAVKSRINA